MKRLFGFVIVTLLAIALHAVPTADVGWTGNGIRTITMEDGLPTNCVRSVVQDKYGFIWFGTDNGLCRYDGYTVRTYVNTQMGFDQYVSALDTMDDGMLVGTNKGAFIFYFRTEQFHSLDKQITAEVKSFAMDAEGDIWVATRGSGAFCHNRRSHTTKHYPFTQTKGKLDCIFVDGNNQVWAISNSLNAGIFHLNKAKNAFELFRTKTEKPLSGMAMLQDPKGKLLIGTWDDGLMRISGDGSAEQLLNPKLTGVGLHIHSLAMKSQTELLIGCDEGMVSYDLLQNTWKLYARTSSTVQTTNDRFIYGITCDNEGGVWMGSFYNGVNYISPIGERFATYTSDNGLHGSVVSRFAEDDNHRVWVATDDGGLNCFDITTHTLIDYPGKSGMKNYNVHGLLAENSHLWVGTYGDGVILLDTRTGTKTIYQLDNAKDFSSCYAFFRDSKGRLWAASMDKVNLFDEKANCFKPVKNFNALTTDIDEDRKGNVWFATQGGGLWCYGATRGEWKQFLALDNDTTSLPSTHVNCLRMHDNGTMYVATSNGLCVYQPKTQNFQRIHFDMEGQDFRSIFFNQDEMWLTSSRDIIRRVEGERLRLFNIHDGLLSSQFQPNAGLMASDGCILFGSAKGFHAFYPYQIKINQSAPHVFITDVDLFDKTIEVGSSRLPESLSHTKQLNLYYGDNMFTISFAALSFISPEKNQYAYRLEGFDKDWFYSGDEHKATYTNIPAGTYTFLVRATNNDGTWSTQEAKLRIVVHPPFWWSWPAKLFYLVLIGFLIYLYTQLRLRREKRHHQREIQRLEEKKEQEIRDARLSFFTMIAHEIRTPVTLIIGPLETLKAEWERVGATVKSGEAMTHTLDVIDRNAQRLLNLVNQLLDFNKVQQQGLQMHFKVQNIARMMHAVAERFEPTLRQNGATFVVDYPDENFTAVIDNEAITKVISNLMTNATKYTKDHVHLSCTVLDKEEFRIEVEDNGIGIAEDEIGNIFHPFYQARDNKPGTGIGLNIVKNLVTAHHGQVTVSSEVGKGSTFTVTLPIMQPDVEIGENKGILPVSDVEETMTSQENSAEQQDDGKATMLIVEDDDDMRNFIVAHFNGKYHLATAENGIEALKQLKTHNVTLIVSDWMMPEMDGATLCRRVRSNQETSHIPFIMLTAKTDNDSKAEGMNCGADVYIEKPFSMKYLEACIRNTIEMRRLLQSKFSHTPLEPITEIATTPIDNDFLVKMNRLIEDNLDNADLNVTFLAEQLGVSRSSLFAKIKGLADVTPNEMIQLVRLKKAARLLQEQKYRVNEVAYMVGFSSPSYFSKCFAKQFGVKPTKFGD